MGACCMTAKKQLDLQKRRSSTSYLPNGEESNITSFYMDSSILNSTYQRDEESAANSIFVKMNNDNMTDINAQFQLIKTIADDSALNEKCIELKNQIQFVQMKMLELQERLNIIIDDKEMLIVLIKRGELASPSKNKFSISITQPARSISSEEMFKVEDSETDISAFYHSNQAPPVVLPVSKLKKITTK